MRSPSEVLHEHLLGRWPSPDAHKDAEGIINAIRDAGYIIVRDDAIRLAQAHARAEALEDAAANDNRRISRALK